MCWSVSVLFWVDQIAMNCECLCNLEQYCGLICLSVVCFILIWSDSCNVLVSVCFILSWSDSCNVLVSVCFILSWSDSCNVLVSVCFILSWLDSSWVVDVCWVDLPVCCFLRLTWGANWTNLKQSSQAACLGVSRSGCVGAGVLWSSRKCLHILACNSMGVLEQVCSGHLGSACTSWRVTEWLCWSRCSLVI